MDIGKLHTREAHDKGAEMQVKDQFGKKVDFYITVVGVDSKIWRNIELERERKTLLIAAGIDADDDTDEVIAKACIGWRGLQKDGEDVEFSYEACLDLIQKAPYIKDQIDSFIARRVNFTKG